MNVAVVGTGYVGLVVGACLADSGNSVTCTDVEESVIAGLREGRVPVYEPGLHALVLRCQDTGRLQFTSDVGAAIAGADVVFIAVATPPDRDGGADLTQVVAAASTIAENLRTPKTIFIKSTVPVGTADQVEVRIGAGAHAPFAVCSNPEFLREGRAVDDFRHPARIVLGTEADSAIGVARALYAPFLPSPEQLIVMSRRAAELTKYVANAMLATRVSFINQIAELCDALGVDVTSVVEGIGTDPRIGAAHLTPGPGYGGACLPKDMTALLHDARAAGVALPILDAVHEGNERQMRRVTDRTELAIGGVRGKRIAVWGLAFKAGTDDVRASPAMAIVEDLLSRGAEVHVHDPWALDAARSVLCDRVQYSTDMYAAAKKAEALVIATEWDEYRTADLARLAQLMARRIVVDPRNLFDPDVAAGEGLQYLTFGRGSAT